MLTSQEIRLLVRRIVHRIQPERVIIFGSYAKGTATVRSDLDLLIIKETDQPFDRRADDLLPLLAGYLISIDIHVYTQHEIDEHLTEPFSFMRSIIRTGKVVFESPGGG